MGKKKTHEQFLEELWEKNEHYRNGEFEVVGEYVNWSSKIKLKAKYGECNVTPTTLLCGGNASIRSAVDKISYFKNHLKDKNKLYSEGKYKILTKIYKTKKDKVFIIGEYGILKSSFDGLFYLKDLDISMAVSKSNYFKNELRCKNKAFYKGELKLKSEYISDKDKVLVEDRRGVLYKASPSNLKRGQLVDIRSAVDKNNYRTNFKYGCRSYGFTKQYWCDVCNKKVGKLYLLHMFNTNESFLKIGVTCNNIDRRYSGLKGYNFTIKYLVEDYNKPMIWDIENYIKKLYKDKNYQPKIYFQGSMTECYKYEELEKIIKHIKNKHEQFNII